jgi:hypothetical protein
MPESLFSNGQPTDLADLLLERIAAGLAGEVSAKSVDAIVEEEMRSPISDDGRSKQV